MTSKRPSERDMSSGEARNDRPKAERAKGDHTPLTTRGRNGFRIERQKHSHTILKTSKIKTKNLRFDFSLIQKRFSERKTVRIIRVEQSDQIAKFAFWSKGIEKGDVLSNPCESSEQSAVFISQSISNSAVPNGEQNNLLHMYFRGSM